MPQCATTLVLAFDVFEQAAVDFAERDGKGLFVVLGGNERPNELEDTFVRLVVVAIDLTGPLGGEDDKRVLGRNLLQQVVNRRCGNTNRIIEDGIVDRIFLVKDVCHIKPYRLV